MDVVHVVGQADRHIAKLGRRRAEQLERNRLAYRDAWYLTTTFSTSMAEPAGALLGA